MILVHSIRSRLILAFLLVVSLSTASLVAALVAASILRQADEVHREAIGNMDAMQTLQLQITNVRTALGDYLRLRTLRSEMAMNLSFAALTKSLARHDVGISIDRIEEAAKPTVAALQASTAAEGALFNTLNALTSPILAINDASVRSGDEAVLAAMLALEDAHALIPPTIYRYVTTNDDRFREFADESLQRLNDSLRAFAEIPATTPRLLQLTRLGIAASQTMGEALAAYVEAQKASRSAQANLRVTLEVVASAADYQRQEAQFALYRSTDQVLKASTVLLITVGIGTAITVLLGGIVGWVMGSGITRPLLALKNAMNELAAGNLDAAIPARDRRDEVGAMARAIEAFRLGLNRAKQLEDEVRRFNLELEEMVRSRTAELQETLNDLRQTQDELVRKEKLAGLGALVAGIAHEINTPVGVGVTVASTLHDKLEAFRAMVEQGALRRSAITDFLNDLDTATTLLNGSLSRAAELIGSFKRVAVDQTSDMRRLFDVRLVTEEVLATLRPLVKRKAVEIEVDIPEGLQVDSFPGAYGQVITNLMTNAVTHGLEGRERGLIRLSTRREKSGPEEQVVLVFSDDGCGIPPDLISRIFDPFVTTKLGTGGSGLGLHIVYTLVTQVLGGRVSVKSQLGHGTTFTITFPRVAPTSQVRIEATAHG